MKTSKMEATAQIHTKRTSTQHMKEYGREGGYRERERETEREGQNETEEKEYSS